MTPRTKEYNYLGRRNQDESKTCNESPENLDDETSAAGDNCKEYDSDLDESTIKRFVEDNLASDRFQESRRRDQKPRKSTNGSLSPRKRSNDSLWKGESEEVGCAGIKSHLHATTSAGPLTVHDIEAVMNEMKKHEESFIDSRGRRKVYVYVERASQGGRFSRYETVLDDGQHTEQERECGDRHPLATAEQGAGALSEGLVSCIRRSASAVLLSLEGILAGYAVQTLYEVFLSGSSPPDRFASLYSPRSNEARRFYFVVVTACSAGSICNILNDDDDAAGDGRSASRTPHGRHARKACVRPSRVAPSLTVLFYFVALAMTLVASRVDVQLAAMTSTDAVSSCDAAGALAPEEAVPSTDSIFLWKVVSLARSVCCLLGWATECHRQYYGREGTVFEGIGENDDNLAPKSTRKQSAASGGSDGSDGLPSLREMPAASVV